jgi:hypothetical protein
LEDRVEKGAEEAVDEVTEIQPEEEEEGTAE